MLDVHRTDDVDPGAEQFVHVLVPLGVLPAGRVGVGQLVHEYDGRPAGEDGVHVHLFEDDPAVLDPAARDEFQSFDERGRFRTAVRFDHPDDRVHALLLEPLRLLKHLVGFADAGREPQVHLQPAPLLLADEGEELLRPWK